MSQDEMIEKIFLKQVIVGFSWNSDAYRCVCVAGVGIKRFNEKKNCWGS